VHIGGVVKYFEFFKRYLGLTDSSVSHQERFVSGLGGLCGIVGVAFISSLWLDGFDTALIMGSMGSSAVLLFAVPHGPLSQPWPLVGGHTLSAMVGVTAATLIPIPYLAAGVAVALAIVVMHYARCLHPPGGATALFAVLGGESIQALGWEFVLAPALLNTLAILMIAVVFNAPFHWRRYPRAISDVFLFEQVEKPKRREGDIGHQDITAALQEMGTLVDISENDLMLIYELAHNHRHRSHFKPEQIKQGTFLSNGGYGEDWSVREVTSVTEADDHMLDTIGYRVAAGKRRRETGTVTRADLALWSMYEVKRMQKSWRRVSA
jgi:CBS-domain-containing membrane protein